MVLQSGNYTLDVRRSAIGFTIHHATIAKVHDQFIEFESVINPDADNPENSMVKATIQASSINTNNKGRDNHLRLKDFFDTGENLILEFASIATEFQSREEATITNNLTTNDITRPVALDVDIPGSAEDLWGQTRVGFEVATKIDWTGFGVDYDAPIKTDGLLLSSEISLQIGGSAVRQ